MRHLVILGLIVGLIVGAYLFQQEKEESELPELSKKSGGIIETIHQEDGARPIRVLDIARTAEALHDPARTAAEDLQLLDELINAYSRMFKGVPEGGLNEEIIAAMCGKNAKNLAVLSPKHRALSQKGELIDRYGTAYYFHPISSTRIDLRSAGPDQSLFTADDIVYGELPND